MQLDLQPIIDRQKELERVIRELTARIAQAPPGRRESPKPRPATWSSRNINRANLSNTTSVFPATGTNTGAARKLISAKRIWR